MKVISPLANMSIFIGRAYRVQNALIIEASEDSTMPATVHATPADVLTMLGAVLRSPSAWVFLLGLPWFWWRARRGDTAETAAEFSTTADINKPW